MKKLILMASAACLFTISFAQDKEKIEGKGKITTRDVNVSYFDQLEASGIFELKLLQGDKEGVKVEADENLQQYINVHNDGSKLVIDMNGVKNKSFNSKDKLKIYVTFRQLKEMNFKTVGGVSSEKQLSLNDVTIKNSSVGNMDLNFVSNKMDLKNSGVGKIKLTGKCNDATIKNTGVGSLEAGNFVVQNMNIENTGVSSAEVNVEKNLSAEDSFLGKIRNKGAAAAKKRVRV